MTQKKYIILLLIAIDIFLSLSIYWPILPGLLFCIIWGFIESAYEITSKIVILTLFCLILFFVPTFLFHNYLPLYGFILIIIYNIIILMLLLKYRSNTIKKKRRIEEMRETICKRNEERKQYVKNMFGDEYVKYWDESDEEIRVRKEKDYMNKKQMELSSSISNVYNESPLNSLLDTFFIFDSYAYIAGISLGYKEADLKRFVKDRKLTYSIDKKARYVISYPLEETGVLDAKIIASICDFDDIIDKLTFEVNYSSLSQIGNKIKEYIYLLLESTFFKEKDTFDKNKSVRYHKCITDTSGEFYDIVVKIIEINGNYQLEIQIGTPFVPTNYYEEELSTYNLMSKAKDRIRNYNLQSMQNGYGKSTNSDTAGNERCYVYLMVDTINNFHKIGISNNPEYRERTLQSEKPTIEKICAKAYPCRKIAESIEKALHASFANKRVRGEWFNLNDEDVKMIVSTLSEC